MSSRFHNVSNEVLADMLGAADAKAKAAAAELEALKAELKKRGVLAATGQAYAVTVGEYLQARIDSKKAREILGSRVSEAETVSICSRVTIKPALPLAA